MSSAFTAKLWILATCSPLAPRLALCFAVIGARKPLIDQFLIECLAINAHRCNDAPAITTPFRFAEFNVLGRFQALTGEIAGLAGKGFLGFAFAADFGGIHPAHTHRHFGNFTGKAGDVHIDGITVIGIFTVPFTKRSVIAGGVGSDRGEESNEERSHDRVMDGSAGHGRVLLTCRRRIKVSGGQEFGPRVVRPGLCGFRSVRNRIAGRCDTARHMF